METSNASDFVIEDGILKKYIGPGRDVIIPDGVKIIGERAFYECKNLEKISFPQNPVVLKKQCFAECKKLKTLRLGSEWMMADMDSFSGCSSLNHFIFPEERKEIGSVFFRGWCWHNIKLHVIEMPNHLMEEFVGYIATVEKCLLIFYKKTKRHYFAYSYSRKNGGYNSNFLAFIKNNDFATYDQEIINNGPEFRYLLAARLMTASERLSYPTGLTEENRKKYIELLRQNEKKLLQTVFELDAQDLIPVLLENGIIDSKNYKRVIKRFGNTAISHEYLSRFEEEEKNTDTEASDSNPNPKKQREPGNDIKHPMSEDKYLFCFIEIGGEQFFKKKKVQDVIWPTLVLKDGSESVALIKYLVAVYGKECDDKLPHIIPEADLAAAEVVGDELQKALESIKETVGFLTCPMLLYSYCRYVSGKRIHDLIGQIKIWHDYKVSGQKGRNAEKTLMSALNLSDTREAMLFLEKKEVENSYTFIKPKALTVYAQIRDLEYEKLRDFKLTDFGLDRNGTKQYVLQDQTYTLTVYPDLHIELSDDNKEKTIHDIPAYLKNLPEYDNVVEDINDIRRNVRPAFKVCCETLLDAYLEKREIPTDRWTDIYQKNPISRYAAERLVWQQDNTLFTVVNGQIVGSKAESIELNDSPIYLMHPMEIDNSALARWQEFFLQRRIKQPFTQLWEPVIMENDVKPDRYKGCRMPRYCLQKRERHGIMWSTRRTPSTLQIIYCDIKYKSFTQSAYKEYPSDDIEIEEFKPLRWNRHVNHVVAYLDKVTLGERVKKDDESIADRLGEYTIAQITEFIKIAQEAKATNVLALLMDYKNENYEYPNLMEEFLLD